MAFDAFVKTWGVKYDKAVECLIKDRDALLAFYDFPVEHWKHLRTTNVIESSFATVRPGCMRLRWSRRPNISRRKARQRSLTANLSCSN